jgi:hypothetical protein
MQTHQDWYGVLALSSAISCHLLSLHHYDTDKSWYENKWFWIGIIGNLPALIAFIAHIHFKNNSEEKKPAK